MNGKGVGKTERNEKQREKKRGEFREEQELEGWPIKVAFEAIPSRSARKPMNK